MKNNELQRSNKGDNFLTCCVEESGVRHGVSVRSTGRQRQWTTPIAPQISFLLSPFHTFSWVTNVISTKILPFQKHFKGGILNELPTFQKLIHRREQSRIYWRDLFCVALHARCEAIVIRMTY